MAKIGKYQRRFMFVAIACVLAAGLVMGQPVLAADVALNAGGLTIAPGAVVNFEAMNVRIVGPDGLVLDDRSTGGVVSWSPQGLPDGDYIYEAVVITSDPKGGSGDEDDPGSSGGVSRTTGDFEVYNGQIVVPERDVKQKHSFLQKVGTTAVKLAMGLMDLLVPSAHAVDLTASSSSPSVWFDDTQDEDCTPAYDWRIEGQGGVNNADTNNFLRFIGVGETASGNCALDVTIAEFRHNGSSSATASSANSLLVAANGDMRLANTSVFIDRSSGRVGIGTISPSNELQINGTSPQIRLFDESTNTYTVIQMNAPWLTLEGFGEQDVFNMHQSAPLDSLNIASNGWVGVGTRSPAAALEVERSGNAVILVDDNGPFGKKQMFILENNGAPSFRFRNSSSGRAWTFAMTDNFPTDEFVINDPFSPGREFFLDAGGNAQFEGVVRATNFIAVSDRNLKDNVERLDGREVLRKVMELPISRWTFKEDSKKQRHIGPMAQDFNALFEVGPDNRHITVTDTSGIALAAIQGLGEVVRAKDAQIAELNKRLDDMWLMVQQIAASNQTAMVE